jgi:predicted amidohydrolase YtcJ
LQHWVAKSTTVVELHGHPLYPGFKDSHAHLLNLGLAKLNVDLVGTRSFDEVIARTQRAAQGQPPGTWIVGRGWHEGKWAQAPAGAVRGFPVHQPLSAVTPDHPVMLERADGHAVLANARAMELMHITPATAAPGSSAVRLPDGHDTNDNAADFSVSVSPTPGSSNH